MIVDANLLFYARNEAAPQHAGARAWLEGSLNGDAPVGSPWQSLSAFLRIATNPRVFPRTLSPDEAWQQVEDWLEAPRAWVPEPTRRYREVLGRLVTRHQVTGPLVTDAQLAALAIDHGVELVSTDTDFARSTGLRWVDPLVGLGA